jgi:LPS-assembly protein
LVFNQQSIIINPTAVAGRYKIITTRNPTILLSITLAILITLVLSPGDSCAIDILSKTNLIENEEIPWEITAKTLSYDEKKGNYVAEGDVIISKENQFLYAQKAVYNMKTGIARVSGDVRLEAGADVVTGESGLFDLKTKTGEIVNGSLFLKKNNFYLSGSVLKKVAEDTYVIKDASVTTCDGDDPDWSFTGSEVKVTVEGYGTIKHSSFRVRGVPILYMPYMIFPAKTKRQTGLLPPRAGYSTLNGGDFELPFFWAISDQTDATLYSRYMTHRGYMQGAEFRYLADESSKGVLQFDILSDRRASKNMTDPDQLEISPFARTNQTRYWLRGRDDQNLIGGLIARLDVDLVSDQDYLREFEEKLFGYQARTNLEQESKRPFDEMRSPTRRTALRLSRDGEGYSLQGLASYYQEAGDPAEQDDMSQPVAGLDLTFLPDQFRQLPIFYSLNSDYNYVWQKEGSKGHNFSLSPEINFPLWFGPYVQFEPSFRYLYDAQWINDSQDNRNRQNRGLYEAKVRLETNGQRIFDFDWGNVKKLKHKISPIFRYTYQGGQGDEDDTPWFTPIDEEIGPGETKNQVSFSLENFLDARLEDKKGRVTYNQWVFFKLEQSYDIHEERQDETLDNKKKPLNPFLAELIVTPFSGLDLRGNAKWDHYDREFSDVTLSGRFSVPRSGGRRDIYEVDYIYGKDRQKDLSVLADLNLAYGFSIGGSLKRDMDQGRNISTSGWAGYQSQCWGVKLGAERDNWNTSVMVVFKLVGLGETGVW